MITIQLHIREKRDEEKEEREIENKKREEYDLAHESTYNEKQ
ncbi:hypothetical protein [Veillonella magna]|nr:hypothetical protein [Veillonella magna]